MEEEEAEGEEFEPVEPLRFALEEVEEEGEGAAS